MKALIFFVIALSISVISVNAQDSTNIQTEQDSISSSHFLGFYKTKPILSKTGKEKLSKKKAEIENEIKETKELLAEKMAVDTISVPRHTTLLGGLITIPKLTEEQKKAKAEKNKTTKLKMKIEKLEEKLKAIEALEKKNEAYYEKSIFWSLIQWEVKK